MSLYWLLIIPFLLLIYLSLYQSWEQRHCNGRAYFLAPLPRRRRLRRLIRAHGIILVPVVQLLVRVIPAARKIQSVEIQGISVPRGVCSSESMAVALDYQALDGDIIVATPMKSGTTWMQQIVYQLLTRGEGDFNGDGHLQALSSWLEADSGVALAELSGHGGSAKRIIKTHLPAGLCPIHAQARYVYVMRDPVNCFASVRDYMQQLYGPFCPKTEQLLDWYLGDEMFFGNWHSHVESWRTAAQRHSNILVLRYEDLLAEPANGLRRLAEHLREALTESEFDKVLAHTRIEYMRKDEEFLEMNPPNLFTEHSGVSFFARGGRGDHKVSASSAARVDEMAGAMGRAYYSRAKQ